MGWTPRPRPRSSEAQTLAPAAGPLTHLPAAAPCIGRAALGGAGRRAPAAAPSFRTKRAEAPARGRDRTAGGAHAPAGLGSLGPLSRAARRPPPASGSARPAPRRAAAGRGRSRERSVLPGQPRAGVPRTRG